MNKTMLFGMVAGSACLAFAVPHVDENDVTLAQDSFSRKVTVNYTLTGEPGIITMDVETNAHGDVWVPIGDRNLRNISGDVNVLVRETGVQKTIYWQPDVAWPGQVIRNNKLRVVVKAWATNAPPNYMVVDIDTKAKFFYTSVDALPFEGGVTNDACKLDYLVMRKIPAAEVRWRMGAPASESADYAATTPLHYVTLSQDYYLAVFETTRRQYVKAGGSLLGSYTDTGANAFLPVGLIPYTTVRGGANWPTVTTVGGDLAKIRTKIGIPDLDFPTEAQWEYACRAGKGTSFHNGVTMTGSVADRPVTDIAWYADSRIGGVAPNAVQPVGLLQPNDWGLYDMSGNASEICLDWYVAKPDSAEVRDPTGPDNDVSGLQYRTIRGGTVSDKGDAVRSASRGGVDSVNGYLGKVGFRFCCPAIIK